MKTLFFKILYFFGSISLLALSQDFGTFVNHYQTKISLPIEASNELVEKDTISKKLLNFILFDSQNERAKFYSSKDSLVRVTTYGRITEEPTKWRTWADESHTKRVEKSFESKAYPIGQVHLSNEYISLITKVVGYEFTYYDLYVYNQEGKLMSLINLYEEEYQKPGFPEKGSNVYTTTSITKEGIIKWHQERFGVTTDREYELRSDGYFEVIKQKIEGEFEY